MERRSSCFEKNNSDIIQKNSIRRAKNLQGRENCKGYFSFLKITSFILCDIFGGNCFGIIVSMSEAEFVKSLLVNEWSMDQQHGYLLGAC